VPFRLEDESPTYLSVVLIHCTFVVADRGHVLDDDRVVRMFAVIVQHIVRCDHVVDHVGLADLLAAELLLRRQVHPVIVAKEVERRNGRQLDAGIDEEVDQCGLHLRLARLEVVATQESAMLFSQLDTAGNEGVLRRTVDLYNSSD